MSQDEATLLARDLHARALQFVQDNLAEPMTQAMGVAQRMDQMTGHAGSHGAAAQVTRLAKEIDQLPPAIAKVAYDTKPNPDGRVVPDSTVKALHSSLKYAEGMTTWGNTADPTSRPLRAAAEVLYAQLQQIDAALGPEQVDSNIVDPAVQRFAA